MRLQSNQEVPLGGVLKFGRIYSTFSRKGKGCTGRSKYEEYGIGEEQEETQRFQINQKGAVSIVKGKEAGRWKVRNI